MNMNNEEVLILVVVEDSLWPFKVTGYKLGHYNVLILVVVEDSLWLRQREPMEPPRLQS